MKTRFLLLWIGLVLLQAALTFSGHAQCLSWVKRTDVGAPYQRANCAMAYDSDRGVSILFGGETYLTLPIGQWVSADDTWEYDGTRWTQIAIDGDNPPARASSAICYDTVRHEMVMVGGVNDDGYMNDTWIYHPTAPGHGAWTRKADLGEPNHFGDNFERAGHGLVFDTRRGVAVLMGGTTSGFTGTGAPPTQRSSEVWEWNGASWQYFGTVFNLASSGQGGSHYEGPSRHGMVFDSENGVPVIAGGAYYHYLSAEYDDWEDTDWGLLLPLFPGFRYGTPVYDRPFPGVVGCGVGVRQQMGIAYDSTRHRIVIFGGKLTESSPHPDPGAIHTEVRSYSSTNSAGFHYESQNLNLLTSPSAREGTSMVYDVRRNRTILFGGARGETTFSDTWELQPVPFGSISLASGSNACLGEPLTIPALIDDTRPLAYRWYESAPGGSLNLLSDQTNQTLRILTNQYLGSHRFTLTIEDECGNQASNSVDIFSGRLPNIESFSLTGSLAQCPGGAVTFGTEVESDFPVTLQWYKDGFPIPGGSSNALKLLNLRHEDSGSYRLVASNYCGSVDTSTFFSACLQVGVTITGQPTNVNSTPCDSADFFVAAKGVGQLLYQWRMEGVLLRDGDGIKGATSNHLHLDPLHYEQERSFDVVVTDDCGPENAVISSPASLRLPTPPWVEVAMSPQPPEQENRRGNWVSAYDENRGVLVLYGGVDDHGFRENSLWEYDGFTWTPIQDAFHGPVKTNGQNLFINNTVAPTSYAAIYNPDDHLVYIIGDVNASQPMAIWSWDGKIWHRPYNGPVGGGQTYYHAVYDRLNHKILIVRSHNQSSFMSELLTYDPASNLTSAPVPMQPPLEYGVYQTFWVYDEYRKLAYWYQYAQINFGPPSMWALDPSLNWIKLTGTPTPPQYAFFDVTYDPVRRHVVEFGSASAYPFETSTRIFPGSGSPGLPAATDWLQSLPDGPPRNAAGLGVSPTNAFFPETIAFDRHRRALVAPGYVGPISAGNTPPFPTWTTYESRYKDAVTFDPPSKFTEPSIGGNVLLKANAVGYGSLTYQWRHNGTAVTNGVAGASANGGLVSGATNATLNISNIAASDFGNYDVVVQNKCGPMTSAAIQLSPTGLTVLRPVLFDGKFSIRFTTDPGLIVTMESAPSVEGPWSKVINVQTPVSGEANFGDFIPTGAAQFYRAVFPAY